MRSALVVSYTETELDALRLLRQSFSWRISLDRRSGVWVATYADDRIKRGSPLGLFDALTFAARTRRAEHFSEGNREQPGTEQGGTMPCDCCQERLEQLAATIHEANAQILTSLDAVLDDLEKLATLLRQEITAALPKE